MLELFPGPNGDQRGATSSLDEDQQRQVDDALDDALEHSFPASDTPSMARRGGGCLPDGAAAAGPVSGRPSSPTNVSGKNFQ
jgi:hypothetical protein